MNKYITIRMFLWIAGIGVTISLAFGGYLLGRMDNLTETFNHSFTSVVTDVATMKADISWIKNYLTK